jgi:hypothetical protein
MDRLARLGLDRPMVARLDRLERLTERIIQHNKKHNKHKAV